MQRSIVSRIFSIILLLAGIGVLTSLFLSLENTGSGGLTGNGGVLVSIGNFLLFSFSYAAFLLPLYFLYPAFVLFRKTEGRTAAYDLTASVVPFFTCALILRLAVSPGGSSLTAFVQASFGTMGGIVVLSLLLVLEILFFLRYRIKVKALPGKSDLRRESGSPREGGVRERKEYPRKTLPLPSFSGSVPSRSISGERKNELLRPTVLRSQDAYTMRGNAADTPIVRSGRDASSEPVADGMNRKPAAGGSGSNPVTIETEEKPAIAAAAEQFSFRVPVIPGPPVLRSMKPDTEVLEIEDTPLSIEDEVIRSEEDLFEDEEEPMDGGEGGNGEAGIHGEPETGTVALSIAAVRPSAIDTEEFIPLEEMDEEDSSVIETFDPNRPDMDDEDADDTIGGLNDAIGGITVQGYTAAGGRHTVSDDMYDEPDDPEDYPEDDAEDVDDESEDPGDDPVFTVQAGTGSTAGRVLEPGIGPIGSGAVRDVTPPGKFAAEGAVAAALHTAVKLRPYTVPIKGLLKEYEDSEYRIIDDATKRAASVLMATLEEFNIRAEVTGIRKGPVITMFEILPAPGVKLSKIVNLADNIALRLAASSVRIVAPIPGKHAVGIEVPNKSRHIVSFSEMLADEGFSSAKTEIPIALGKDIAGSVQIMDLVQTPHLLIAGSTGSGKSVCVNSLICSILYRRAPDEVRLMLIDPKIVELKFYNDIPHLLTPVITEPKRAFQALQWCIYEMERRYTLLDALGVRDIRSYNRRIRDRNLATQKLPYIVVVIDEFADLMATTGKELESTLARLAAMSRAVGIHLVLATQRPSIDVITGLIKANIPSRIAFMVASKFDSRIIIDAVGAEKLLGRGDMLFASAWDPFPVRLQGAYLTEEEVERIVAHVKTFGKPDYIDDEIFFDDEEEDDEFQEGEEDPLMEKAVEIIMTAGKASASYLQRRLKIGYNRAARLVEILERRGVVGPQNGSKPREILHIPDGYQQ